MRIAKSENTIELRERRRCRFDSAAYSWLPIQATSLRIPREESSTKFEVAKCKHSAQRRHGTVRLNPNKNGAIIYVCNVAGKRGRQNGTENAATVFSMAIAMARTRHGQHFIRVVISLAAQLISIYSTVVFTFGLSLYGSPETVCRTIRHCSVYCQRKCTMAMRSYVPLGLITWRWVLRAKKNKKKTSTTAIRPFADN